MKIFVIDTGYGEMDWKGHGTVVSDIISYYNPNAQIENIFVGENASLQTLCNCVSDVHTVCMPGDFALITWCIPKNKILDTLVAQLSNKISVIVSAGNQSSNIENFSPCNLTEQCTVVHCVKKDGTDASFTNYGSNTVGMYGTNITCMDGVVRSGSSISAAIYCGIVSRNSKPMFLTKVKNKIKKRFYKELYG